MSNAPEVNVNVNVHPRQRTIWDELRVRETIARVAAKPAQAEARRQRLGMAMVARKRYAKKVERLPAMSEWGVRLVRATIDAWVAPKVNTQAVAQTVRVTIEERRHSVNLTQVLADDPGFDFLASMGLVDPSGAEDAKGPVAAIHEWDAAKGFCDPSQAEPEGSETDAWHESLHIVERVWRYGFHVGQAAQASFGVEPDWREPLDPGKLQAPSLERQHEYCKLMLRFSQERADSVAKAERRMRALARGEARFRPCTPLRIAGRPTADVTRELRHEIISERSTRIDAWNAANEQRKLVRNPGKPIVCTSARTGSHVPTSKPDPELKTIPAQSWYDRNDPGAHR